MAKEGVAAGDAAYAYASSVSLMAVDADAQGGPNSDPTDQDSRDAMVRTAEAVRARASAPVYSAEVAEGAQLDLMV